MILTEVSACNPICRACHYKNLNYSDQLARKQRWARECLDAQWENVLQEIIPAPPDERIAYRSKSWMRSSFMDGELSFGMIRAAQVAGEWTKEFVSWNECPLHIPSLKRTVDQLRKILVSEAPTFSKNALLGVWVGSPHLVIVSREKSAADLESIDWSKVLIPPFNRVWFHHTSQVGKKVFGAYEIRQIWGPPSNDLHPIRAFRQVAGTLLQEARARALEGLLRGKPELVLDLYCGTGSIASLIPESMGWIGIEHSKEAVIYAQSLRKGGAAVHQAYEGAVEHRLRDPRILEKIPASYALYINPPRPGLGREAQECVRKIIREKPPKSIVYLSCSASSLARDLEFFCDEGFRIESLQPYDFFPMTEHFETLAILAQ